MSSLHAFLHPIETKDKEVIISERFREDGKSVAFKIRPITQKENEALIKKYTKRDKKGNETFDRVGYSQDMTASAVIFPDLENAELQKAYNSLGAVELLKNMLYVGEFANLAKEVQEISGLEQDINEEIEEAKN